MSTRAQKVSTAFIHGSFVLIVIISVLMVSYALFWIFYPIEDVYYDIQQPYEVRHEVIPQGEIQQVRLVLCKKRAFRADWTQALENESRNEIETGSSNLPEGCNNQWIDIKLPEKTSLGQHRISIWVEADIHWLTPKHTFKFSSDYFEIVE